MQGYADRPSNIQGRTNTDAVRQDASTRAIAHAAFNAVQRQSYYRHCGGVLVLVREQYHNQLLPLSLPGVHYLRRIFTVVACGIH